MARAGFVRRCVALAGAATCALAALAASAGATTIGATATPDIGCSDQQTIVSPSYAMPGPGQITSFAFHSIAANSGSLDFLALRPTGTADHYTVTATTGLVAMDSADDVQTIPLAVQTLVLGGDVLGMYVPPGTNAAGCGTRSAGLTDLGSGPASPPAVGDTVTTTLDGFPSALDESAEFTPSIPLDSTSSAPVTGPVLDSGNPWLITVRGTYSVYKPIYMSGGKRGWVVCGSPEADVQFGDDKGSAGQDAQRIFARVQKNTCDPNYGLPHAYDKARPALQFDTGDGTGFHTLAPTDNDFHADHTYSYVVPHGFDAPLKVRLLDSNYADNYGTLEIDVSPISS